MQICGFRNLHQHSYEFFVAARHVSRYLLVCVSFVLFLSPQIMLIDLVNLDNLFFHTNKKSSDKKKTMFYKYFVFAVGVPLTTTQMNFVINDLSLFESSEGAKICWLSEKRLLQLYIPVAALTIVGISCYAIAGRKLYKNKSNEKLRLRYVNRF